MKTLWLILFLIPAWIFAQQDTALKHKADRLMPAHPSEALSQYQKYLTSALSKKITNTDDVFAVFDSAFTAAIITKKYEAAEKLITGTFELALKLKDHVRIYTYLPQVVKFYMLAEKENWPLKPVMLKGKPRSIILPVSGVKYITKDSAILTITGGMVEGLYPGLEIQCLGTKLPFLSEDRSTNVLGRGRILTVGTNGATAIFHQAYTTDSSDNIYPKDVIYCTTNPIYRPALGDYQYLADNNIALENNYREDPYHLRQLAYYTIPHQKELLDTFFLESLKEIADMLRDDSNMAKLYPQKIPSGFFRNSGLVAALDKTSVPHIHAFNKYVKQYPGKYYGQRFKFSEVYATWLIYGCPLDETGLIDLLTEYWATPFYNECLLAYDSTITKGRQWLVWKDNFLDSLDNNSLPQQTWDILQNTADHYNVPEISAWKKLLEGRVMAFNKRPSDAEKLIREGMADFEKLKMKNEILFAENMLRQVNNQRVAKIALQNNHTLPFYLSFSPDGKYFATYGDDYTIKIWDAKLVRQIETISAHVNRINQVTFTPTSKYFISASDDGYIRVWDTRSLHLYKEILTNYRVKFAALNHTGDHIIAAGSDSGIHIYNFENSASDKKFVIHKAGINTADYNPDYQHLLYTGGSDSMNYIVNLETGKWTRWFKSGGKVSEVKSTDDRQYIAALSNNDEINLWEQNGNFLGRFPTTKYPFTTNPLIPGFDLNTRKKAIAFVNKEGLLCIGSLDSLIFYPYKLKFEGNILDIKFHPNGNSLMVTTNLGRMYYVNLVQYHLSHGSNIQSKIVGVNSNLVSSLAFSDDDSKLAYQSGITCVMDLGKGKNINLGPESFSQLRSNIYFSHHDSALVYVPLDAKKIHEKNFYSGDTLSQLVNAQNGVAYTLHLPDEKFILTWFNRKSIDIFESSSHKLLHRILLDSSQANLLTAEFIPENRLAVFNDVNYSVSFYELKDPVLKPYSRFTNAQGYEFGSGCYDPVKNILMVPCQDNNIYFFDPTTGKLKDTLNFNFVDKQEGAAILRLHPDGHTLFVGMNNLMLIYDLNTKKIIQNFNNGNYTINAAQFSHDGKNLAVGGFSGIIYLFDSRDYHKIMQVQTFGDKEPVWITPDNYYIASRSSLEDLYFSFNHTLYPFDQFDINFNRPDTVLQAIGRIEKPLLNAYKEAWYKRFKKSGIPAERLRPDFKVPELTVLNEEEIPAFVNTSPVIPLQMKMTDDSKIVSYNIWVNGVPLYGKEGKKIQNPRNALSVSDSVVLSGFTNVVQVACKNENGMESLKEKFEVKNYVKDTTISKTYVFCVSVSDYKDKKYSLKYARKDGRDFVTAFKNEFGKDVYIDTLFDEKATLKNILAWKKIMEKTTIKDRVILYVSGHGLLDKDYNFYYATYDIDFKNPAVNGLAYDELEKLLDKIPARKKLLLMDACHSGEVDKDAVKVVPDNSIAKNDVKVNVVYKSKGVDEDESTAKLGLSNSFELMQELFANLNNGNGTVVISAAAGNSYAFESDVWNNGIFTYCLLHGLKDKAADLDHDESISVGELQKFVSNEVQRLTKGAQKPTARQENLENDWFVW